MQQEEIKFIIIVASITLLTLSVTLVIFLFFIMKKKTQFIIDKQESENKFKEEIMLAKEEVQEQTLKNVSWILHDNIGQLLSVLNIQLHQMGPELNAKNKELLDSALEVNEKTIQEVRALSHTLNEDYLKKIKFQDSIKNELKRLEDLGYIIANFDIKGQEFQLNDKVQLILFRIFQEFLNNTIKHSEAKNIYVEIEYENDKLSLTLKDNGKGFDTKNTDNYGIGLTNIMNRIKLIDADFDLSSDIGKGTSLVINYRTKK